MRQSVKVASSNRRAQPTPGAITSDRALRLADLLRAMAHPLRLRIIALLCHEDINVGTLATRLSAAQAIVSQHLRILRMSRLVDVARQGGCARYRLAEPALRELVRCMEACDHA
jgi:DNA-binding transcriptional ArsR family regulator